MFDREVKRNREEENVGCVRQRNTKILLSSLFSCVSSVVARGRRRGAAKAAPTKTMMLTRCTIMGLELPCDIPKRVTT
jgi:hypothetical protein